ncbi:MAG: Pr6Pr family membrane protein [Clostridia bacterium]|nr:Pr6Pr family membrane protein [Clostridia bacterium]
MSEKILKIIKICLSFAIAFVLVFTALFTYREHLAETYELTFLSSFIVGIFFIACSICFIFNKRIPQILYLCATILLLIVFFVCIVFSNQFQMGGGFAFLHIVNPLLVLAYYLVFCDLSKTTVKLVPMVAAIPLLYLVFVLIFGSITGNYIYFFMNYEKVGIGYSVIFIIGILVGIFVLGFALYYLNRLIQKLVNKNQRINS